jgi:hypothetical protein
LFVAITAPLVMLHGAPASTTLPLASHFAQSLLVPAAVALAYFVPVPDAMLVVTAVAGSRAADNVPLAMLLAFVVSVVADAAKPVTPLAGTEVAAIAPVPLAAKLAPEPITRAALVLAPLVSAENAAAPVPQGAPASTTLPFASHFAQSLLVPAAVALAYFVPVPDAMLVVTAVAGSRAADNVPLAMLLAFVVSVVADAAKPVTPLAGTEVAAIAPVPLAAKLAPEPITKAALVFAPLVSAENAALPAPVPQGAPASITLPFASHFAQLLLVADPVELAVFAPLPVKLRGA